MAGTDLLKLFIRLRISAHRNSPLVAASKLKLKAPQRGLSLFYRVGRSGILAPHRNFHQRLTQLAAARVFQRQRLSLVGGLSNAQKGRRRRIYPWAAISNQDSVAGLKTGDLHYPGSFVSRQLGCFPFALDLYMPFLCHLHLAGISILTFRTKASIDQICPVEQGL
jgi:hypothetical protein